jgi:hypothetical protein
MFVSPYVRLISDLCVFDSNYRVLNTFLQQALEFYL